jgi:hypothetical protein
MAVRNLTTEVKKQDNVAEVAKSAFSIRYEYRIVKKLTVTLICRCYSRVIQINESRDAPDGSAIASPRNSCARSSDNKLPTTHPSIRLHTFFVKSHKNVHYTSQFCEDTFMSRCFKKEHILRSRKVDAAVIGHRQKPQGTGVLCVSEH